MPSRIRLSTPSAHSTSHSLRTRHNVISSSTPPGSMSGVMVVWANLPDEALEWYEDDYLPEMTALHSSSTLHCEVTSTGLDAEPIGHLDAPWELMAVYEVADVQKMSRDTYSKDNHPPENSLLANARFDVRTYREIRKWGAEDWDGDMTQVVSVSATEWRVAASDYEEVMGFYTEVIAPTVVSSEEVLRLRIFEVDNATVFASGNYITKDKDAVHTYFTLIEIAGEDWPWDKILELSEFDQWKRQWETQDLVKWQTSHFLVQRLYPEPESGSTEADEENSDADA